MQFGPPDDGPKLAETHVGDSYILLSKLDSECEFRWLIFSRVARFEGINTNELRTLNEHTIQCSDDMDMFLSQKMKYTPIKYGKDSKKKCLEGNPNESG